MAYEYDRFEREEGGGSFLMGLLAGTVLGAGLGMLFAPKAGSELRSQLGTQLADGTGRLLITLVSRLADPAGLIGELRAQLRAQLGARLRGEQHAEARAEHRARQQPHQKRTAAFFPLEPIVFVRHQYLLGLRV